MSSFFKTVNLKTAISKPINIEVSLQEIISVTGRSGIGKSLFFRAIADLDPHEGDCFLNGTKSLDISPAQWRKSVSYLANDIHWWDETVLDHFASTDINIDVLIGHLKKVNLDNEILHRQVKLLSSGESQRLGILRSLISNPKLLLLDEPFSNLDEDNKNDLKAFLKQYVHDKKVTILMITHQDVYDQHFFTRRIDFNDFAANGETP